VVEEWESGRARASSAVKLTLTVTKSQSNTQTATSKRDEDSDESLDDDNNGETGNDGFEETEQKSYAAPGDSRDTEPGTDYQRSSLAKESNTASCKPSPNPPSSFAKHLSPATLQALVYMWHPDAFDNIDDHLDELSTFSNTTMQSLMGSEGT